MSKHENVARTVPIYRPWSKIDPKVIVGAVSSLTVGGIVSAAAAVGVDIPTWLAALFVIVAYAVAAYLTRTRIPIAPSSGLSPQMAAGAAAAVDAGVAFSEGTTPEAIADAFHALGYILDDDGNVIDGPDEGPAELERTTAS